MTDRLSACPFVVISLGAAIFSIAEKEDSGIPAHETIHHPVDLDKTMRSARWWPWLEGLAVFEEPLYDAHPRSAPSRDTIERIQQQPLLAELNVYVRSQWLL